MRKLEDVFSPEEVAHIRAIMREDIIDELREEGWLAPSDMWEIESEDGTVESPPWIEPFTIPSTVEREA